MRKFAIAAFASLVLAGCGLFSSEPEPFEPDSLVKGVNFIGLTVSDLQAAESYYASAIEGETVDRATLEPGNILSSLTEGDGAAETLLIRRTNSQLRIMQFSQPSQDASIFEPVPVQGPGIAHMCFQVAEKTDAYNRILAAGAVPIGDPELVQLSENNPVHYGYVKDSDGTITEIEQVDLAKLNLPEPPRNSIRVRHVSMATPDLERMIDFYSKFLGGQKPRHVGSWMKVSGETVDKVSGLPGSEIEMAWFQLRNLEIEIFQYHSHPSSLPAKPRPVDAPGYNMIVFDVADVADARARLIEAGGTVVSEIGSLDGGQILFGRDPDGNLIGLQKLPEASAYSAANFPNNGI